MSDDITIKTRTRNRDYISNIEVAFHSLAEKTEKQASEYLNHLIAQVVKQAVMVQFGSIQRIVDEAIHSDEMKTRIYEIIEEEMKRKAEEIIKEMFGKQ